MLHKTKELVGDRLVATDGEIGQVDGVYFDDERWGKQVEQSPDVDTKKSVSRQYEETYARHYGISLYWAPPEAAAMPAIERAAQTERELEVAERKAAESHLRSSDEVIGYSIQATDGAIGHVEDLLRLRMRRGEIERQPAAH